MLLEVKTVYKFKDANQLAAALKNSRLNPNYFSYGQWNNAHYKYSQQHVADELGISRIMYQHYENGTVDLNKMSDDLFDKMCTWLGIILQEKNVNNTLQYNIDAIVQR